MNALARILEWPSEAEDALGLALWDAASLARTSATVNAWGADADGAHRLG